MSTISLYSNERFSARYCISQTTSLPSLLRIWGNFSGNREFQLHEGLKLRIWDKRTPLLDLHLLWSRPFVPSEPHPFLHLYLFLDHRPEVGLFHRLLACSSPPILTESHSAQSRVHSVRNTTHACRQLGLPSP